jgi:YebC/PmpR family DNA-binding regulatory protein
LLNRTKKLNFAPQKIIFHTKKFFLHNTIMGRAFEYRRARKEARWGKMAKVFTRIGREIAIAVKQSGPDPTNNSRLRVAVQNAKGANMPKERVESAIKRASSKEAENYEEAVYEGYGPHGVAILVECQTDNTTRTVANVRTAFNRGGGALGKTGSLDFIFERKAVFKVKAESVDIEELEFELIDFGAEDVQLDEEEGLVYVYTAFSDFGQMQKALEEKNLEVVSSELERIPSTTVDLSEEQIAQIEALIERLEDDEDVSKVFHNMA